MTFIGGDERMLFAAGAFAEDGFDVCVCGFDIDVREYGAIRRENTLSEALSEADHIILPLPYSNGERCINAPFYSGKISLDDVLALRKNALVMGGRLDKEVLPFAIDYYAREDFAVLNALPTAEGAVKLAIEQTKRTLCGTDVAVLGFGRVGKVLAKTLVSLGANVTVYARSAEARAWARVFFCKARRFENICEHIGEHSCIFNTVPEKILGARELACVSKGALLMELASAPYGVDADAAKKCGVRFCIAQALPGKITPKSAGQIIYQTIKEITEEEEK